MCSLQPQKPISGRLRTQARPHSSSRPQAQDQLLAWIDLPPISPPSCPLCAFPRNSRAVKPPVKPSKSSSNCFLQELLGGAPRRVKMTFKSQSPHRLLSRNAEEFLAHSALWVLFRPGQVAGPRILRDGEWDLEAPFKVSECTRRPVQIFSCADRLGPFNPGRGA